jgi:UDP-N-acetylmuramoylalanine--D-glutamate ligase
MYKAWNLQRLSLQPLIVAGLGREGWSTFQFLRHHLPTTQIFLTDDRPLDEIDQKWSKHIATDQNTLYVTKDDQEKWPKTGLLIRTPGLAATHPLVAQSQYPITSNTQLFFDLLKTEKKTLSLPESFTTIGITGTKGKSTTTAIIAHLLKTAGLPTKLGGNIGVPPLDLLQGTPTTDPTAHHYYVLELSAHQLADLQVSPQIAVIQNIVPEHLDYYRDFNEYLTAKSQITRWQSASDTVIYNPDFATARKLALLSPGHKVAFRVETYDNWLLYQDEPIIKLNDIPLVGEHNWQNVLPAIVIGKMLSISTAHVVKAITTFQALEHRLELVADLEGVRYYNDSLSTVPDASIAAIRAFEGQPVILLAGGYERHQDFTELAALVVEHPARAVLLFPTTGSRLKDAIETYASQHPHSTLPELQSVKSMAEAVKLAATLAQPGDVVLMSPASPSFGEFTDYRDRGEQFRAAVDHLAD